MASAYIPFGERVGDDASGIGSVASAPDFLTPGTVGSNDSDGGNGGSDSGTVGDGSGFDPDIHVGREHRNADGSYRKKRGRRSGPSAPNKRGPKANSEAGIESLTRILTVLHIGIASATKTPEMALEEEEAKSLAGATSDVLKQFDIRPDPKVEALIGLAIVAGGIYGPRVYLIRERLKEEKEKAS